MSKLKAVTVVVESYPHKNPKNKGYSIIPLLDMNGKLEVSDKTRSFIAEFQLRWNYSPRIFGKIYSLKEQVLGLVRECYMIQKRFDYSKVTEYRYAITDSTNYYIQRQNSLSSVRVVYPDILNGNDKKWLKFLPISTTAVQDTLHPFKTMSTNSPFTFIISDTLALSTNAKIVDALLSQVDSSLKDGDLYKYNIAVFIDNELVYSEIDNPDSLFGLKNINDTKEVMNQIIASGIVWGVTKPLI